MLRQIHSLRNLQTPKLLKQIVLENNHVRQFGSIEICYSVDEQFRRFFAQSDQVQSQLRKGSHHD